MAETKKKLTPIEQALGSFSTVPLLAALDVRAGARGLSKPSHLAYLDIQCGWGLYASTVLNKEQKKLSVEEWTYLIAFYEFYKGLGFVRPPSTITNLRAWHAATVHLTHIFTQSLKIGRPYAMAMDLPTPPSRQIQALYEIYSTEGCPAEILSSSPVPTLDLPYLTSGNDSKLQKNDFEDAFGRAIQKTIINSMDKAYAVRSKATYTEAHKARDWFMAKYPMLGALSGTFEIIASESICRSMEISIAAVNAYEKKLYFNPLAGLSELEYRFVMAHEILHVALEHQQRCGTRDAYLWNIACDFFINNWLIELRVGLPPKGILIDPTMQNKSCDEIYDILLKELKRPEKESTLAGRGRPDMVGPSDWWTLAEAAELERDYRRALANGLEYHTAHMPGTIPLGFEAAIRAILQPSIPWAVELSYWFQRNVPSNEPITSYFKPSRRQSATPDMPRPSKVFIEEQGQSSTFAVILDTSGSMPPKLLMKLLGVIQAYALERNVEQIRLITCDAAPYDLGYVHVDQFKKPIKLLGGGGTMLQCALDYIALQKNIPRNVPVLILTDGDFADSGFNYTGPHAIVCSKKIKLAGHFKPVFYVS